MNKRKILYIIAAVLLALLLVALMLGDEEVAAKLPSMIFSIVVGMALVLGVIVLAYVYSSRHRNKEEAFRKAAVAVTGRVVKIDRARMVRAQESVYSVGGDMHILRAEYEYQGQIYKGAKRSYFGQPPYKVGDSITVYVNPANPAEAKILEDKNPVPGSAN